MNITALIAAKGTTATSRRATNTLDAGGAPIQTFNNNLTSVKVFVQDISGDENPKYGREAFDRLAAIYIEPGKDILEKDRLVIGSRTFEIEHVHTRALAGVNKYMKCIAVERDGV